MGRFVKLMRFTNRCATRRRMLGSLVSALSAVTTSSLACNH